MMPIVVKCNDGGVLIVTLVGQAAQAVEAAPDHLDDVVAAEIRQWPAEQQALVSSWRLMPDDDIPVDRTFRNAWQDTGTSVTVHMPKARDIHRNRLRQMRAPLLSTLDIEYMRADEAGDEKAKRAIAARKQALRDVTADPTIDAAETPDELKAAVPSVLVT